MTFDEWWQKERSTLMTVNPSAKDGAIRAWNYRGEKIRKQQARIEALDKLLDPETLARKIGDWDFKHNSDYFCWKFGGDGDNGEMLIEALEAILQEANHE